MREIQFEPRMIANREVRCVPAGWEHPRDERGRHNPLLPEQMPEPGDGVAIMAYETTSEGTPISPAFPDTPEPSLGRVHYCVEHTTTYGKHHGPRLPAGRYSSTWCVGRGCTLNSSYTSSIHWPTVSSEMSTPD